MVKPVIAIVGRPNVGKSTLFNRLVGSRAAITEEEPGTTRDRIYGDIAWRERVLSLVDTGGLELAAKEGLAGLVQDQARVAIAEADAILFLVDAQTGITTADEEVANLLRRAEKPVILVANKAETPAREQAAVEFYNLGLGEPVLLSAYHGTGIDALLKRVIEALPVPDGAPQEGEASTKAGVNVAIVGRPNVGKSQLVNAILGEERVLVSSAPGTTRDAVDTSFNYQGETVTLIDTAGVRRPGRVGVGIERYSVLRALRAIHRADIAVLVLDATEGVTAQDTHIAGYVRDEYKGLVVAVNKWDLASSHDLQRQQVAQEVTHRIKFFAQFPIFFISAKLGQGIETLLQAVQQVHAAREKRVPTAVLNQCIQHEMQSHPPATVQGSRLKILYVTQAETAPPTFVFFVNDAKLMHFSYKRFLENRLREAFGFEGTAIRLIFKSRREE